MENIFIKDGKVNLDLLLSLSDNFTKPKKSSNGRVDFKAFLKSFGNDKEAVVETKIGNVEVKVESQFWKMLKAKENRSMLLLNIQKTLSNPLFIVCDDDAFKFINTLKKKNGQLFNMISVCALNNQNKLVLKTSYQIRDISVLRKYALERGEVVYTKEGLSIKSKKLEQAWENFDKVFTHLKGFSQEEKISFAVNTIVKLENDLSTLKKKILKLKSIEQESKEPLEKMIEKQNHIKSKRDIIESVLLERNSSAGEEHSELFFRNK